jgi:hypothetical protein
MKALCENPVEVAKEMFWLAWKACGGPRGLQFLMFWLFVFTSTTLAEEPKQIRKTGVAAYNDFREPYKTQFTEKWKGDIKRLKYEILMKQKGLTETLRNGVPIEGGPDADGHYNPNPIRGNIPVKSMAGKKAIQKMKEDLSRAKERLKSLERNDPPLINIPANLKDTEPFDRETYINSLKK